MVGEKNGEIWMTVSCFTWCIHVGFAEGDVLLCSMVNHRFSGPFGRICLDFLSIGIVAMQIQGKH